MTRATLMLFLTLLFFVHIVRVEATPRLPLSHRNGTMQGNAEGSRASADRAWKFALLGLAGLSFLIRKRL